MRYLETQWWYLLKTSTLTVTLKFSFLSMWKKQIIFVQKAESSNSIKILHGKKELQSNFVYFKLHFAHNITQRIRETQSGRKNVSYISLELQIHFFLVLSELAGDIFLMRDLKLLCLQEVSLVCPGTTASDFSFLICSGFRVIFFLSAIHCFTYFSWELWV